MKRISVKRGALALALAAVMGSGAVSAAFKVVGYFPTWQGDVNSIAYDKVTHINYSFILPTPTGGLQPLEGGADRLRTVVQRAHASGAKVLIAVGGWNNGDDSAFRSLAANSSYRTNFVSNILNFINQYGLDGVDIDWEYPDAGAEANNFRLLMQELSNALKPRGKLLTAAVTHNDWPGSIDSSVINSVDFLNLMVYDLNYPYSTYQAAQNALTHWKYSEGLPKDKAVLGVPFYSRKDYVAYRDVIARYGASAAQIDNAGGLDYNGQPTIRAKSQLALNEGGGIMFWEISQDTRDSTSLMSEIWSVVGAAAEGGDSGGGNSGGGNNGGTSYPSWQAGTYYNQGDIVTFNGRLYIAEHANPGYDPTISTWFWEPYTPPGGGNDSGGGTTTYPTWSAGTDYNAGAIVNLNGKLYIAEHANPGYNPTISTWYWEPYTPSGGSTGGTNSNGPYSGSPVAIPGTLEAEHYDKGRFNDTTSGNSGNALRQDNVDIEQSTTHGHNIGWIESGEWLEYTVRVASAGSYKLESLVASQTAGGRFTVSLNGQTLATVSVPVTSGWQNWTWVNSNLTLPAGEHRLRITMNQAGFNLNALKFTRADGGSGDGGLTWRRANLTNYTSYPDPGSEECIKYNGCQWAGQFAFVSGKQPESWVKANNIAAVHSKDAGVFKLKTLRLRQGGNSIDVKVYDMCSDSDCDGCCTANSRETGFLIDIEKHTMQRFGSGSGIVEWTCLDCN